MSLLKRLGPQEMSGRPTWPDLTRLSVMSCNGWRIVDYIRAYVDEHDQQSFENIAVDYKKP